MLRGKRVLITGGGRGLGAAIAHGMALQGASIDLVDIDQSTLTQQVEKLRNEGFDVTGRVLDISDRKAVDDFAKRFTMDYDGLDVLVNNAGIAGQANFDTNEVVQVWDKIIAVNLQGAFNVSHAFVPALKKKKGNVVHLCSVVGFVAGGSTTAYIVSKGAIRSLTQAMARDLAPHGIRVNAVAPGIMASDMGLALMNRPHGADWFINRVMLGRIGDVEEVVPPVIFLSSSMASYITGTILPVDGGFLAA